MRDSSLQVRVKWMGGEKSSEPDPVFGEAWEGMDASRCVKWEWGEGAVIMGTSVSQGEDEP